LFFVKFVTIDLLYGKIRNQEKLRAAFGW